MSFKISITYRKCWGGFLTVYWLGQVKFNKLKLVAIPRHQERVDFSTKGINGKGSTERLFVYTLKVNASTKAVNPDSTKILGLLTTGARTLFSDEIGRARDFFGNCSRPLYPYCFEGMHKATIIEILR